jgi:hypothetical protein
MKQNYQNDQNRVMRQVGVSPVVALELGYLNSFQERASGVDYFNRDIMVQLHS